MEADLLIKLVIFFKNFKSNNLILVRQQEEIMTFRMQKGELDFTIGVLNRIKQQTLIANLIQMQMQKIIKRKMAKGNYSI